MAPMKKLFLEEQMKVLMPILLHTKIPAASDTLQNIGVHRLPVESTHGDYTNIYHPKCGFQRNVLDRITKKLQRQ